MGEVILALLGLVFTAQGLGLTRGVPSRMNDRPEWIAIGTGMVVLAGVLFWLSVRKRSPE